MHAELETLLELQDLKMQRRELDEAVTATRQVEEEVFNVSIEDALEELDRKIEEMEDSLRADVRSRYRRLAGRQGRPGRAGDQRHVLWVLRVHSHRGSLRVETGTANSWRATTAVASCT